jgi:hypothetical protein
MRFRSQIAAAVLALGALLCAPAVANDDVVDDVILAKLGMEMLSKDQQQVLWQRVERYAEYESFASFCGRPSHIERRVIGAIQPCITPASIQQVMSRFRKHLHDKNAAITAEKSVCEDTRIKTLIKQIHTAIDTLVNEVTNMCKSCLIC